MFDDGEGPVDVACAATVCVTVGEQYTVGGLVGGTGRAIAWTLSDGARGCCPTACSGAATVTAVTTFDGGFIASGHDDERDRAMLWSRRTDGCGPR